MTKHIRQIAWGIKHKTPNGVAVHVSYDSHASPQEAIRAFEKHTGKTWDECVREGAEVVEHAITELDNSNQSSD